MFEPKVSSEKQESIVLTITIPVEYARAIVNTYLDSVPIQATEDAGLLWDLGNRVAQDITARGYLIKRTNP